MANSNTDSMLGYPINRLLAILDSWSAAKRACDDLIKQGFDESDLAPLVRAEGLELQEEQAAEQGVFGRIILAPTAEFRGAIAYREAARDGRHVLSVYAPTKVKQEKAIDSLRRNGAHFVNFYGILEDTLMLP